LIDPWRDECRESHRRSCLRRLVLVSELYAAKAT